jgi:hypothetical protein
MQLRQRETSVCWAANRVCVHDLVISGEWDLAERDSGGRARVRTCGQRHGPDSAASSMQSKSGGGPAVPRRSSSSDPSELALFYLRPLLRSRTTPPPGASSQEDTHAPRSTTPAACWELIDDPCVHGHLAAASSDPYFWASVAMATPSSTPTNRLILPTDSSYCQVSWWACVKVEMHADAG